MTNLYSVSYNTNNTTGGVTPPTQSATSDSASYTFRAPTAEEYGLAKTGYTFIGWAENPNTAIQQYDPGGTINLNSNSPNKILYAIWVNWSNIATMQSMSPEFCASADIGETKQLIDTRDGASYSIKKLSDNKCWMIQNLRITNKIITPNDSDVTSNYTIPASSNPWEDNDANTNKVHYAGNENHGAYYTWFTATAGTSGSITSTNSNDYPATASGSICPKGWRLPNGDANGEFKALYSKGFVKVGDFTNDSDSGYWLAGNSATAPGAAFFAADGRVNGGKLDTIGNNGFYWSSTTRSSDKASFLYLTSTSVNPSYDGSRYYGRSIRCVAK